VNWYFAYRYSEGFSIYVKKDNTPILWFLLWFIIAPVAMILTQIELNKLAEPGAAAIPPVPAAS